MTGKFYSEPNSPPIPNHKFIQYQLFPKLSSLQSFVCERLAGCEKEQKLNQVIRLKQAVN